MKVMTPEQFEIEMKKLDTGDTEADHGDADFLLCKVLRQLGYGKGVDIFHAMDKWYA